MHLVMLVVVRVVEVAGLGAVVMVVGPASSVRARIRGGGGFWGWRSGGSLIELVFRPLQEEVEDPPYRLFRILPLTFLSWVPTFTRHPVGLRCPRASSQTPSRSVLVNRYLGAWMHNL